MKILMLGWELPPYHSGGLGVACYQLCKALALQGVEIDFVLPYKHKHSNIGFMRVVPALATSTSQLAKVGGAYDTQSFQASSGLRAHQQAYTDAVARLTRHSEYDLIHAHDWLTFEAGLAAKQQLQIPLIAHVHATEFDRSGRRYGNPIVHDIEQQVLSFADKIVAVSRVTKSIIEREYHIPATAIAVLHNSIDLQDFTRATQSTTYVYLEQMKRRDYKVVVSLGRLTVQKGLTYLLQAARLVIERQPKTLFLIAGTGDQYHELVQLSAELGIAENVLFTGRFTGGKAQRDAFAIADMFVMPSVSEPFGITALEAIGSGGIALVSKQAGVGEVLRHVMKFDYWDTQRLADQILALTMHETLCNELHKNAYDEFKQMSWQKVASTCRNLYEQLAPAAKVVS